MKRLGRTSELTEGSMLAMFCILDEVTASACLCVREGTQKVRHWRASRICASGIDGIATAKERCSP